PDVTRAIDEIVRGPVLVEEAVPRALVRVEGDRVFDREVPYRRADVAGVGFEGELRRVDADDDETVPRVFRVQVLDVRERPDAVDARVRPEVDEDDLAAQRVDRQRPRVVPPRDAGEIGSRTQVRELAQLRIAARPQLFR